MVVVVHYQLHDYERELYIIDTDKLDENHLFESAFKNALIHCDNTGHATLDGKQYNDDWGKFNKAKVKPPVMIDKICSVHVDFDY